VGEATATLKREPVQVVLCQHILQDGTWLDVLNRAGESDPAPAVVVLSCPDDRLWAEASSSCAYDVLPLPCTAAELYSIVPMAWRHCKQQEQAEMAGSENRA
jgi:DNA-binding NtrC family response regulator